MVYVSNNHALVELLQKFVDGTAGSLEITDAKELIMSLKSSRPDIVLTYRHNIDKLEERIRELEIELEYIRELEMALALEY